MNTFPLQALPAPAYSKVRALFQPFDYSLSIRALLRGNSPGCIFVDQVAQPRTALALTVEGYLLAGASDNPGTNAALREFLRDNIFTGRLTVNVDEWMCLAVHPQAWEARLPELIPTHEVETVLRYHYLCRAVKYDWRAHLPEGYTVQRIDRDVLNNVGVTVLPEVARFLSLEATWGTLDNFLAQGLGFCAVHAGEVVAWCFGVCAAEGQIELGIVTALAHRRRGLAAAVAAATAEGALQQGFSVVGWHCDYDTVGSWKTAEKIGFVKNRDYVYYYYIYELGEQLAQLGWRHFTLHAYAKAADYFERAFALNAETSAFNYHFAAAAWAALGDSERALHHLRAAVERGWKASDRTARVEEFQSLHGRPEWGALLAQMGT
jgi:hypothetical protein